VLVLETNPLEVPDGIDVDMEEVVPVIAEVCVLKAEEPPLVPRQKKKKFKHERKPKEEEKKAAY
jgi:hypothetical protein